MRNLLLPALATVLASCAPLMQQSLPSGATSLDELMCVTQDQPDD